MQLPNPLKSILSGIDGEAWLRFGLSVIGLALAFFSVAQPFKGLLNSAFRKTMPSGEAKQVLLADLLPPPKHVL